MVAKYNDFIMKSYKNKRTNDIPLLADITTFTLQYLFKNKTPKHKFDLEINLVDDIIASENDIVDLRGTCQDYDLPSGRKYFKIKVLQNIAINEIIDTLVHELVHLYQTAMDQLVISDHNWKWKGKSYGIDPYKKESDYWELPWEANADDMQRKICKKFFENQYRNW